LAICSSDAGDAVADWTSGKEELGLQVGRFEQRIEEKKKMNIKILGMG